NNESVRYHFRHDLVGVVDAFAAVKAYRESERIAKVAQVGWTGLPVPSADLRGCRSFHLSSPARSRKAQSIETVPMVDGSAPAVIEDDGQREFVDAFAGRFPVKPRPTPPR